MTSRQGLLEKRLSRRDMLLMAGSTTAVALLSACGAATPVSTEAVSEAEQAPEVVEPTAEVAAEPVTLVFWNIDWETRAPDGVEAFRSFYDEQLPAMLPANVTLETTVVSDARFDKIQASIAAADTPDVAPVDHTEVAPLLALEGLNAMPEGLFDVTKSFGAFANDFFRMGGEDQFFILPWGIWERGVFYNIDLLEGYGYGPDDLPSKISDLIPFCQELTQWEEGQTEPKLAAWPLAGGTTFDFYTACVDNLGGYWWLDDLTAGFGEPEWEEAWTLTLAMFDVFKLDAREGLDAIDRFYNQQALFLPQQLWVGFVLRRDYPDVNWGLTTHPTPSGGPPYGWKEWHCGWGNLSLRKDAELDAAWQLWKALYSEEWTRANALSLNYIPGRLEAQGKAPFVKEDLHYAGAIIKHEPGNSVTPGFWPEEMWKTTNEAWEAVYKVGDDIRTALQQAKAAADVVLSNSPEIQETIITKKDYIDNPSWTDGKLPAAEWWDKKRGSYLTSEQGAALTEYYPQQ